jgi:hypothetical protein
VPSIGTIDDSNRRACLQPPRMVSARSVPRLAFGRWLRSGTRARPLRAPCFKGIKRSRRIATWASSNKLYHPLKLVRPDLGRYLVDATLMEQQNSCYDRFGHTLGGGPPHRLTMKFDSKNIGSWLEYILPARCTIRGIVGGRIGPSHHLTASDFGLADPDISACLVRLAVGGLRDSSFSAPTLDFSRRHGRSGLKCPAVAPAPGLCPGAQVFAGVQRASTPPESRRGELSERSELARRAERHRPPELLPDVIGGLPSGQILRGLAVGSE